MIARIFNKSVTQFPFFFIYTLYFALFYMFSFVIHIVLSYLGKYAKLAV